MPNVVSYCRVSSDEQAQKDISVPAQRKAIARWVEERPELKFLREFVDEGESAYAPADKRTGFCEMIAFCRKNEVSLILVHKLDRFSRNREESILFKSLLRKNGTTVKSITENYDPETPQGFLYEGMIEVINQFYSMNLATETIKGMREAAERGYHIGGRVPYGYALKRVADGNGREHGVLVPGRPEEVAVVREIFEKSTSGGLGSKQIANELNARGVKAPKGLHWNKSTINHMLAHPVYAGDSTWNRHGRTNKGRDPAKCVVAKNTHEALVDRETFEKRQASSKRRSFDAPKSPPRFAKYLLSRLIECSRCGRNYVGHRKTSGPEGVPRAYRYICNGYVQSGPSVCPPLPLDKDWLEGRVLDLIRQEICNPERLDQLEAMVRKKIEARRKTYLQSPRAIEQKITGLDEKIRRYYDAIGEGLDPAVCREKIAELQAQRAKLQEEADVVRQEDYYVTALEKNVAAIREFAANFNEHFTALPFGAQRQVVLHFVEKMRVIDGKDVEITLRVPFDNNGVHLLANEGEPDETASPAALAQAVNPASKYQSGPMRGA